MTNPGGDTGETPPSEPSSGGQEAAPIEQSAEQPPQPPSHTPPPAYPPPRYTPPPASGYPPRSYPPPDHPQSYPPPSGSPQAGYAPPPYRDPSSYGAPAYPPPPQYGTPPGGYGQPPSGYPAPDYASGYGNAYGAPTQRTNSLAIGSLAASIIGVLCGIGSIIGIVLGVVALNQIKQTHEGGRGLAIAGIAVGAVTLLINLIWTIWFLNV